MANKKNKSDDAKSDNKDVISVRTINENIKYQPKEHPILYVNHAGFSPSNYEIKLHLGDIAGISPDKSIVVAPRAQIVMSYQFFKDFAKLVNVQLKELEAQVGKIPDFIPLNRKEEE